MPASCSARHRGAKGIDLHCPVIACSGAKKLERVVAPVILEALLNEMAVIEKGMDRQKLDRRDAELAQMRDHAGRGQAAKSAAQCLAEHPGAAASGP